MAAEHWYNKKKAPIVGASEMKTMARNKFSISYLGISSSTRGASETLEGGGVGTTAEGDGDTLDGAWAGWRCAGLFVFAAFGGLGADA